MSGDLKWNKILGAGLATVFVILVVREGTAAIYHSEAPEKMGYFVDAPEEAAGGAAEVELAPDWGTVMPTADLAAGEAAFARCQACHTATAARSAVGMTVPQSGASSTSAAPPAASSGASTK